MAIVANHTEDRVVAEQRSNRHPEFLQETMFEEHGTKVLITNPAADVYLDQHHEQQEKMRKLKEKYANWIPPQDDYVG